MVFLDTEGRSNADGDNEDAKDADIREDDCGGGARKWRDNGEVDAREGVTCKDDALVVFEMWWFDEALNVVEGL